MTHTIRSAQQSDAAALAALAEKTFRATFGAVNPLQFMDQHCQQSFGEALQLREILDPQMATLLCEDHGRLVGFSQLCFKETPPCLAHASAPGEIRRLYVLKNYHGHGVAQQLMAASIEAIRKRGADVVWLGVWEENPRAIAFYRKINFVAVGEQEFHLGTDRQRDIIMARPVTPDSSGLVC